MMNIDDNSIIIGRSEKADFPELHLQRINIKIDTGAYTSSIHCCKILNLGNEQLEVVFLDPDDPQFTGEPHVFNQFIQKNVKSSNSIVEQRYIISTKIRFDEQIFDIDLSLTNRGEMRFPVLLGRKFLKINHFIVNPRLQNILHKSLLKKSKN